MNDSYDELEPKRCVGGEGIQQYVVEDVEHHEEFHGAVTILGLNSLPVNAKEEVQKSHARLQEN